MRRRDFAKTVGAGIATFGISSTVTARSPGQLPNDNVESAVVMSHAPESNPTEVPPGSWIVHRAGWIDAEGGDKTAEDVQNWLAAVEFTASIDGEPIDNPDQYWSDVYWSEEYESYVVLWEYATPPKKPGVHSFTSCYYYPDGFTDGSEVVSSPGYRKCLTGYYDVVPRNQLD